MAKRKRKRPAVRDDGTPDPKAQGAAWRALMREDRENLPTLVWQRVFAQYRIDLRDERQASDLQVYRLLVEIMELCGRPTEEGEDPGVDVTRQELEAFVDGAVVRIFRKRK